MLTIGDSVLAYLHLTLGEGAAARRAMRDAWRAGARLDAWSLGVCAASLLPTGILESLRRVKAAVRR